MTRTRSLLLLGAAVLTACTGASDPPAATVYGLQAPVVLQNEHVRFEILEESLALFEDGSAWRGYRMRVDYASPAGRDTTLEGGEEYLFAVEGTRIELFAECNDTASCAPGPHLWGEVTGDGLLLHSFFDPDVELRYARRTVGD
jgi:hypothetical protein